MLILNLQVGDLLDDVGTQPLRSAGRWTGALPLGYVLAYQVVIDSVAGNTARQDQEPDKDNRSNCRRHNTSDHSGPPVRFAKRHPRGPERFLAYAVGDRSLTARMRAVPSRPIVTDRHQQVKFQIHFR